MDASRAQGSRRAIPVQSFRTESGREKTRRHRPGADLSAVRDGHAGCLAADAGTGPSRVRAAVGAVRCGRRRSEEHTSELQSLMRISYAVFCLKKNTHLLICYNIIK